jgi:hypothetical protein
MKLNNQIINLGYKMFWYFEGNCKKDQKIKITSEKFIRILDILWEVENENHM